jgi:hypothetical protein
MKCWMRVTVALMGVLALAAQDPSTSEGLTSAGATRGAPQAQAHAADANRSLAALVQAAVADYQAARYEQALARLQPELDRSGDQVAPEVRLNAAMCALRLLRSRDAEELVAPLTEHAPWAAEAAFLLGLAASQHAERAVVAAKLADAEPMAWVMASRAIQSAELQFRQAVTLRPEWREAVRNLERTMLRRQAIDADREAAKPPDAKQENAPKKLPDPPPSPPDQAPDVVIPEIAVAELTAQELAELQQLVRMQQQQKVGSRLQRTTASGSGSGRDW